MWLLKHIIIAYVHKLQSILDELDPILEHILKMVYNNVIDAIFNSELQSFNNE